MIAPSDDEPFRRAAAGLRAFAIVLLWPAVWALWQVVPDLPRIVALNRPSEVVEVLIYLGIFCLPTVMGWMLTRAVRRGSAWAITVSLILLATAGLFGLFCLYIAGTIIYLEYTRLPPYDYRNAIKAGAFSVTILILLSAMYMCACHLRKAKRWHDLTAGARGFMVDAPRPVEPL